MHRLAAMMTIALLLVSPDAPAQQAAHEVLHKIRNAHPGAAMISLRGFSLEDAVDILAYAKTLPIK